MLNAVGLQNPGIDAVIREELPRMKGYFHKPVIANIGAFPSTSSGTAVSASTKSRRWA